MNVDPGVGKPSRSIVPLLMRASFGNGSRKKSPPAVVPCAPGTSKYASTLPVDGGSQFVFGGVGRPKEIPAPGPVVGMGAHDAVLELAVPGAHKSPARQSDETVHACPTSAVPSGTHDAPKPTMPHRRPL